MFNLSVPMFYFLCTYTAVQYCLITELAPLLDTDEDKVRSLIQFSRLTVVDGEAGAVFRRTRDCSS